MGSLLTIFPAQSFLVEGVLSNDKGMCRTKYEPTAEMNHYHSITPGIAECTYVAVL